MRLYELFKDPNLPAGLNPVINAPDANKPNGSSLPTPATAATSTTNTANTANIAPNGTSSSSTQISPAIKQKLAVGSFIDAEIGTSKQKAKVKVVGVANGVGNKKIVNVVNPQKPNEIQAYDQNDLAQYLTNQEQSNKP